MIEKKLIEFMLMNQYDECDILFTSNELIYAIKKGKSTAPGEDGITYDIIRALAQVPGNPLLNLYNLSYINGVLPDGWTISIIYPVLKGLEKDKFRPISLTSCLCKTFERMISNRLMFRIRDSLSNKLNGFLPKRNEQQCIATFLSNNKGITYTAFIDLKSAFDIANREIIIYELAKMNIGGKLSN